MDFFIFSQIPEDKIKHFLVSLCLFFVFYFFRKYYLKEKWFFKPFAFALRDTLIIWIFKEIIDLFWFWNPQISDLFANWLWILIPIYIYYIYKESKDLKLSKYFRQEALLIKKLENKTFLLYKRFKLFLEIKVKTYIFKRKILYYIPSRTRSFLFKKSFNDFIEIIKYFIHFSIIWFINLVVMIVKIPLWAVKDSITTFIKFFKFAFLKV